MRPLVVFEVPGAPVTQGSKSVTKRGVMYDSNAAVLKPWRGLVTAVAARHRLPAPLDGPVELRLRFFLPRPRSHYRTGRNSHLLRDSAPPFPHGRGTGDLDKLTRAVGDSLTDAGVIVDDSIIVDERLSKRYAGAGTPGVVIELWPAS